MKKELTIMVIVCGLFSYAKAQNKIGVIAGGVYAKSNLANQYVNAAAYQSQINVNNIYSYFGGFVYDIHITNEFSVKTKLLLMKKGWEATSVITRYTSSNITSLNIGMVNVPSEYTTTKETYLINYLELPLDFTFYTPLGKNLLSFGVGPYVSYGLQGKYKYKVESTNKALTDTSAAISFDNAKTNNAIAKANRIDYGAALEVSLQFRLGLFISAGYTVGITNTLDNKYGSLQNRSRVITIGAGYFLKARRRN